MASMGYLQDRVDVMYAMTENNPLKLRGSRHKTQWNTECTSGLELKRKPG